MQEGSPKVADSSEGVKERHTMVERGRLGIALAAVLLLGLVSSAGAQQRAETWWDWVLPVALEGQSVRTSRGHLLVVDSKTLRARGRKLRPSRGEAKGRPPGKSFEKRGRGEPAGSPAFCRSGSGHPVHGQRWCLEKGFGLGEPVWHRGVRNRGILEDILLRIPVLNRRRGDLDRAALRGVLGDAAFDRLDGAATRLGVQGPLAGRWLEDEAGTRVLQMRVGSAPLAELTDLDGDGRVDVALVNEARAPAKP